MNSVAFIFLFSFPWNSLFYSLPFSLCVSSSINWVSCACVLFLSCVWLFATPWTVAQQAPLSMGFPRQEYWSGFPFPSPGDLPHTGMEPESPTVAGGFFTTEPPGRPPASCFLFHTAGALWFLDALPIWCRPEPSAWPVAGSGLFDEWRRH